MQEVSMDTKLSIMRQRKKAVDALLKQKRDALFVAVGGAIIAWAMVEIRFDELLISMSRHDSAAARRRLFNIMRNEDIPRSFGSRLKLCGELAPIFYKDETLNSLKALTKVCRGQYRTRNRLAHGEWLIQAKLFDDKTPPRIISKVRRFGKIEPERVFTTKQIDGLTKKYRDLTHQIVDFLTHHHPEGPSGERLKRFFDTQIGNQTNAGRSPTS